MLTIEETRNSLWSEFSNLSDNEVEQIRDEMYKFWISMIED